MRQNFSSETYCVKGFSQSPVLFRSLVAQTLILQVILLPAEVRSDRQG